VSWLDGPKAAAALRRGQRSLSEGDLEAATAHCETAAGLDPGWLPPKLWLAQALSELGRIDEAIESLEAAKNVQPDSPMVYLWWGRALFDHQRYSEACEVLERGTSLGSNNLHLPVYLALAEWADGREEQAFDELERLWAQGDDDLAGRWLLLLEERFPGGPGNEFPDSGPPPKSIRERLDAWRAVRLVQKASRLHEEGKHETALGLLDRAEYLRPGQEKAHELGVLVHRDAAKQRREQLEADPHDVDIRLAASEDLLEIGLPDEALEMIEPAEEAIEKLDPNRLSWRAEHALIMGRVLLGIDTPEDAVEHLERGRDLWPTEVEPYYYLGVAYLRCDKRSAARAAFTKACELDYKLVELRAAEYRAAAMG